SWPRRRSTARAPRWSRRSCARASARSTPSSPISISTGSTPPPSGCSTGASPTPAPTTTRARWTRASAGRGRSDAWSTSPRADARVEALKHRIVGWLVGGLRDKQRRAAIAEAAAEFQKMDEETRRLAARHQRRGKIAYVNAAEARGPYDKTVLLLHLQKLAPVAAVRDSGMLTLAAPFDSGWDFVALLALGPR